MASAVEFLLASQNTDGGWGYKPDKVSYVEPTSAVVLALSSDPTAKSAILRAQEFLKRLQHPDGGWGIGTIDPDSGWMTAWAVWALAGVQDNVAQLGADWLLTNSGIRITDTSEIAGIRTLLKIDPSVTGWAWQPGDASWVFPTALALLALTRMRLASHPRVREGIAYLLDRAISGGGWNIGNPYMVTGELSPTTEETVISALALQVLGVKHDAVKLASDWLSRRQAQARTASEVAWLTWFSRAQIKQEPQLIWHLVPLQRPDGSWNGNAFTTAVAMMTPPEVTA